MVTKFAQPPYQFKNNKSLADNNFFVLKKVHDKSAVFKRFRTPLDLTLSRLHGHDNALCSHVSLLGNTQMRKICNHHYALGNNQSTHNTTAM